MTEEEEVNFRHQVDKLEDDVDRINSESRKAGEDIKALQAAVTDLQAATRTLIQALAAIPDWLNREHRTAGAEGAFKTFSRHLEELQKNLSR